MKKNDCFNCLHHGEGTCHQGIGWAHSCKLGIENEGLQEISTCEKYEPNRGFQMGGYYTHTHFEQEGNCLNLIIHGDLEFPRDNPEEFTTIHLCDFKEIEKWVKFWGEKLRKKGMIK